LSKLTPKEEIQKAVQETIAQKHGLGTTPDWVPGQFRVTQQITQSQSPFPAPEILKLYNDAVPKGAERIVKMAEREQKHVHRLQYFALATTFIGEILAFSVVAIAMFGSFWLINKGKDVAAGTTFVSALGILTVGYYERRKFQQKQQAAQAQRPPEQLKS
jgi:uncharacterized membrane protein